MCGGRRLEVVQIFAFIVDSDQKLKAAAATEHAIVKKNSNKSTLSVCTGTQIPMNMSH